MHAGVHCIASERSWQTALVSLVFLFFLSSWLRKKILESLLSWRWMDVPVLLLFDFSWLCRVILAGESWRDLPFPDHLQWSAANISSYYLFLIFLSHSFPCVGVFLTTLSFFSPHLLFSFWPSRGAHNLPVSSGWFLILFLQQEKEGWAERQKGQLPLYSELWSAFFCHSGRVRGFTKESSQWDTANV